MIDQIKGGVFLPKYDKKINPYNYRGLTLPGNVLLSQGQNPNYHRR